MKSVLLLGTCILLLTACRNRGSNAGGTQQGGTILSAPAADPQFPDSIPVPAGMTQLDTATGDLDHDGVPERVIVYDTKKDTDMGTERVIHIFRKGAHGWALWHKSTGAVLPSQHGGVMGDPFQELTIQSGVIVVEHFGGSRDKWAYTHRYRYQHNNWYLIGATIHYGAPCEEWKDYDYNLSTGRVDVTFEQETCDDAGNNQQTVKNEQFSFTRKLPTLPLMDGFYPGDNEVKIPEKGDASFYY